MRRILCVGSRLVPEDAAGPRVHDLLVTRPIPEGVEVVDGGLAGLRLLSLFDGAERVVVVDAVDGWTEPGQVRVLRPWQLEPPERCDHDTSLSWLLAALPGLCEVSLPEVWIVGLEGPVEEETIQLAAHHSLHLAVAA